MNAPGTGTPTSTRSAPARNTDRAMPTWQRRQHTLPRVFLSTGRMDIHPAFRKDPHDYLERFFDRPLTLFPALTAVSRSNVGLILKAPAEGRGKNSHDQRTGLSDEALQAVSLFSEWCIRQPGAEFIQVYIYTRPAPQLLPSLSAWPTAEFATEEAFGFWLDSTAKELALAVDLDALIRANGADNTIVPPTGIEGWGDLYEDRPGPALMNWRKVHRDDRHALDLGPRAWRLRERLSGTPWLYTLTIDPRSNEEIPLDVLEDHHAMGRSVVCINPSDELAAAIDRLYAPTAAGIEAAR